MSRPRGPWVARGCRMSDNESIDVESEASVECTRDECACRDCQRADLASQDGFWVHREPSSGPRTEESYFNDEKAFKPNDGRGETRTMVGAPGDEGYDPDLAAWNDDCWVSERAQQNFEADKRRFTQTFANQLDCSSYQTERAVHIVENVELRPFAAGHRTTEMVALGVISLVVDEDVQPGPVDEHGATESWTIDDWIIYRDEFQSLMDDVGMEMDDLWAIRRVLMEETGFFGEE